MKQINNLKNELEIEILKQEHSPQLDELKYLLKTLDYTKINDQTIEVIKFCLNALIDEQDQYNQLIEIYQRHCGDDNPNKSQASISPLKYELLEQNLKRAMKKVKKLNKIIQDRSDAGKHSPYKKYKEIIEDTLSYYEKHRSVTQKEAIGFIERDIFKESNIKFNIPASTFNNWLHNYRKLQSVFKP